MRVDTPLALASLAEAGEEARRLEALGYDGAFTFDGPHDPFFPLVQAATATERIEVVTAVAIAFARSPMLVAQIGHDLQMLSKGRFRLGLGSQVRAHIERRFSQPWSRPAARMREFVSALRAIWSCWNEGAPLAFRGDFYTHTLMPPLLRPAPCPFGAPPVWLAGVGPRMTEVAGEVADGFLLHPFHTAAFLADVTGPALECGLARAGRARRDFVVSAQVMIVSGRDASEIDAARTAARAQIAFYASTPAYRGVLDSVGRGALHPELHALSRSGDWRAMAALVDDALLEAIAVCAPPEALGERLLQRYTGFADRISLVAPWQPDAGAWADVVRALQAARV
ncbi:MAG: TIGR03617 family F420-dependent LLM class oxidoreductase [Proteobacteria bacterium]|nr:TIGR03617 family F420-dependent LLM class oxidoreductase [Pseudomonadota bacterium]